MAYDLYITHGAWSTCLPVSDEWAQFLRERLWPTFEKDIVARKVEIWLRQRAEPSVAQAVQKLGSVMQEAHDLVYGDRAKAYGPPEENFARWSKLCAAAGIPISPRDLAMVMALGKIARAQNAPKRDNMVDLCGYAEIVQRLDDEASRKG